MRRPRSLRIGENGLTFRGRTARVVLLLLGTVITAVGATALLLLAATSRRLPDPPAVIVPADLSGGSYSLSVFLFVLLWGTVALLAGVVALAKGFAPEASVTLSSRSGEFTGPQGGSSRLQSWEEADTPLRNPRSLAGRHPNANRQLYITTL